VDFGRRHSSLIGPGNGREDLVLMSPVTARLWSCTSARGGRAAFELLALSPSQTAFKCHRYAEKHLRSELSVEAGGSCNLIRVSSARVPKGNRTIPAKAVEKLRLESDGSDEQSRHPFRLSRKNGFVILAGCAGLLRSFGLPPQAFRRNARAKMGSG